MAEPRQFDYDQILSVDNAEPSGGYVPYQESIIRNEFSKIVGDNPLSYRTISFGHMRSFKGPFEKIPEAIINISQQISFGEEIYSYSQTVYTNTQFKDSFEKQLMAPTFPVEPKHELEGLPEGYKQYFHIGDHPAGVSMMFALVAVSSEPDAYIVPEDQNIEAIIDDAAISRLREKLKMMEDSIPKPKLNLVEPETVFKALSELEKSAEYIVELRHFPENLLALEFRRGAGWGNAQQHIFRSPEYLDLLGR